ncbi:LysR family transcriptional regulator [Nitrospirillum sp. BR 11164]|uniref:LysR family transcriptional regulator n=1 Tax=Nitrospirillum sp. BR 11164 TaxID=3104324 RepID=UPI002AFDE3F7|nr:LysR family transcriptional regulator [Nitrospirillum sp. BR 11164]MEA1651911.1 LysR family transcriptional regulator [Nitrospirillum sp. BR 11164]
MASPSPAASFRPLDLDAVHAFVLVATLRSFTRAAEALGTTQSAISLKLKRLEDRLGQRLLERTPRQVRLSSQGAAFLEPARRLLAAHDLALAGLEEAPHRLVIGISDHVAGRDLPGLLARLQGRDPTLVMEVRIAASRDLGGLLERGDLDAAILRLEPPLDGRPAELAAEVGEPLFIDPLCWFAAPGWEPPPAAPCPSPPCPPRAACAAMPCGRWTPPAFPGPRCSWAVASPRWARPCWRAWASRPWHRAQRPWAPSRWAGVSACRRCPARRSCCAPPSATGAAAPRWRRWWRRSKRQAEDKPAAFSRLEAGDRLPRSEYRRAWRG